MWRVVDLFSGAGGMSYGFHAHPAFRVVGAADAELAKPSDGLGSLECNGTYARNIGVTPVAVDLSQSAPDALRAALHVRGDVDVLSACAPCTGFSRAIAANHVRDDPRNSLVARMARYVEEFRPAIFLMENARELLTGNFRHHYDALRKGLERLDYEVEGSTHVLSEFGLPQLRERALVIAARRGVHLRTLDELWEGARVSPGATTVERAIRHLPPIGPGETLPDDPMHTASDFGDAFTRKRIEAIPRDGGGWIDLTRVRGGEKYLTPNMRRLIEIGRTNSYCDIYGRMAWASPAPTIKRECAHVGNGRYTHPEQHRLCSVREMALLQGFPRDYAFVGRSRKNLYRQVGDAVPPLVSYQIAGLCAWMLGGGKPKLESCILPGTSLEARDIVARPREPQQLALSIRPTAG